MGRYVYGTTACERLYEKLKGKLKNNCKKLLYQTKFQEISLDELMQEATILFFKRFSDYYEEDEQYLRFLFVAVKNKIRTMQQKEYSYINRYKNSTVLEYEHGTQTDYNSQFETFVDSRDDFSCPLTLDDFKHSLAPEEYIILCDVVDRGGSWEKAFMKHGVWDEGERMKIKKRVIALV